MAARKRAVLARVARKRPERELRDTPKRETLWWFDYETPKCQRKEFRGAYMYEGLQTFKSKGRCERALEKIQTPTAPVPPHVPPIPLLKTIKIRSESIGHRGTIYKAMTDLGANVSQFKYEVWQTIGRLTERIEVKGKETTNYGAISFNIPYSVRAPLGRRIAIKWGEQEIAGQRYKAGWTEGVVIVRPVTPPPPPPTALPEVKNIRTTELRGNYASVGWDAVSASNVAYKVWLDGVAKGVAVTEPWKELSGLRPRTRYKVEIRTQPYSGSDRREPSEKVTYYFTTPIVEPIPIGIGHQPVLPTPPVPVKEVDVVKHLEWGGPEGTQPDTAPVTKPREVPIRRRRPERIAQKRQMSERVKELMKKRGFPKAVKEAIEKGLEREGAPRDIERIIEKVAKINEPNYILRRTIARRIARGEIVQYKVDTDKGTIIYVNADEKDVNAILGMPTPTGEVIPLQIKVIR